MLEPFARFIYSSPVLTSLNGRPFTSRIIELRRHMRYTDLENKSNRARSTAWFNNLVNGRSQWNVNPPPDQTIDDLATLMSTTAEHVRQMIAEEWYGVRTTELSARVRSLAPRLDALNADDAALVEQLVQRLQPASLKPAES